MDSFIAALILLIPFSSCSATYAAPVPGTSAMLIPVNSNCSAASSNATFQLAFISYGNWTSLSTDGETPQHLESVSFAVSNAANAVNTTCAFSLGAVAETTWQACADRKDTDGKHVFTVATEAAFGLVDKSLAVNQTWFCHDDAGRLVAYTGIANTVLDLTCSESEVSGYHLQNCTSPDLALPVTLL
ncbi:hypothetical protein F5B22DRAFT_632370 [Xylaria bambusicola]|uniref:uncharacterized protein n=1 Tax=Xylaria bambusicola TaxID=326684 RepID=UPI0020083835|nr:uncharacterized protein F5B22DRAFT_632370 [Xylaria bambusicola]KAI0527771.1 hypothetical protein F5B22DRAFT_632370 [Xylaria bambusicola]